MPLSGSVTAGSAALASQYNNLRSDVLSTTQGHTHTGASEDGKKVHGTALDSTGATNGQVLTANGSGGVTFAAPSSSGALSLSTASAAFSTASGAQTAYVTGAANASSLGVSCGGSTFLMITNNNNYSASARIMKTFDLNNTTAVASASFSPVTAGTTIADQVGGAGLLAGTAFVVKENYGSGTQHYTTMRKYTRGLTNSWNTICGGTVVLATGSNNAERNGPFGGENDCSPRWSQTLGAWYGGDYRPTSWATATGGGGGTVSVWLINDVSGSAYSAVFGTASSTYLGSTYTTVFVPDNVGTPTAGTIHAWGRVANSANNGHTYRYCKYTVGSASITAASTADNLGPLDNYSEINQAIWDNTNGWILLFQNFGITALDRTGGTVMWSTPHSAANRLARDYGQGINSLYLGNTNGEGAPEQHYDPITMITAGQGSYGALRQYGAVGPSMLPVQPLAYTYTSNYQQTPLMGAGSATHWIFCNSSNGTVYSMPIAGVAKVQVAGTSSAAFRNITTEEVNPLANGILAFDNPGGYELSFGGTITNTLSMTGLTHQHIVPGSATFYAYVRNMAGSASGWEGPNEGATVTYQIVGGTATLRARTITMA